MIDNERKHSNQVHLMTCYWLGGWARLLKHAFLLLKGAA